MTTPTDPEMITGSVLWFDDATGYGFAKVNPSSISKLSESLKSRCTKEDLFFHWTAIESKDNYKKVLNGQMVNLVLEDSEHGPRVTKVIPLPHINEKTGNQILLASTMRIPSLGFQNGIYQTLLGSKERYGLKYLHVVHTADEEHVLLAIDKDIVALDIVTSSKDLRAVLEQIVALSFKREELNEPMEAPIEGFPFDIKFM